MNSTPSIGQCIGCGRSARLHDGVCRSCLVSPTRGRKWAELMSRCRQDPQFARVVYNGIQSETGKRMFTLLCNLSGGRDLNSNPEPMQVREPEFSELPTGTGTNLRLVR